MSASLPTYYSSYYQNQENVCQEPSLFIRQTNEKIGELNPLRTQIVALATLAVLVSFVFCRAASSLYLAQKASDFLKGQVLISGCFTAIFTYAGCSKLNRFLSDFQKTKRDISSYPREAFRFQEKKSSISNEEFAEIRACFPENFNLMPILNYDAVSEWNIQGGKDRWGAFRPLESDVNWNCPNSLNSSFSWKEALLFVARAQNIPQPDKQEIIRGIILILDPKNVSPFASLPAPSDVRCQKQCFGGNELIQFKRQNNILWLSPKTIKNTLNDVYGRL